MSPDPFRTLDRIDPPDQWDEIARRARSERLDLDLDALPHPHPRRRAVAVLVAAAAVVAVLTGAVVATAGDGDEDGGVVATSTPDTAGMAGPCPFTLDPDLVVPELVPGSGEPVSPQYLLMQSSRQAPPTSPGSWGTVDYGGIPVTIAVYADAATAPDHGPGSQTIERPPDDPHTVDVILWRSVEGSASCGTVEVRTRLPLTDEDVALEARDGTVDLSEYMSGPVAPRIARAVQLIPTADDSATTSTLPADQLALDGACPFRLDPAAGIGPLTPIDRPEDANAQRSDRPATWGSVLVGDDEVLVGVGEADPQRTPSRIGERSGYEGGGGQDPTVDTLEGSGWLTDRGPCSFVSARAYLPTAPRTDPVPGEIEPPSSEEILVSQRLQWLVDRVLDAVVAPGPDGTPLTLDCGGRSDPDGGPTAEGRRCPVQPDPATLPPVTFPEDDGEPPPPEPPTPASRPAEVYFEAEAWDGFPIYVTRGSLGVCITATAASEGCSGGDSPKGLSPAAVPDPDTGEPGGVALLGAIPEGAVSTEVRSANGPVPGAEVTIAPDGLWFVAWVPIPLEELGLVPWPIVHRDASGDEIPI